MARVGSGLGDTRAAGRVKLGGFGFKAVLGEEGSYPLVTLTGGGTSAPPDSLPPSNPLSPHVPSRRHCGLSLPGCQFRCDIIMSSSFGRAATAETELGWWTSRLRLVRLIDLDDDENEERGAVSELSGPVGPPLSNWGGGGGRAGAPGAPPPNPGGGGGGTPFFPHFVLDERPPQTGGSEFRSREPDRRGPKSNWRGDGWGRCGPLGST